MNDLNHIAEAILLLYHFWTFLVGLIVLYLLFRDAAKNPRNTEPKPGAAAAAPAKAGKPTSNIIALVAFIALLLLSLASGHYLVIQDNLLYSFLALACGFVACALIYFTWMAKYVQRPAIRYVLFVWVALGLSVTAIIGFFAWGSFRASVTTRSVDLKEAADIATPLLQFGGILMAAVMVAMTNLFTAEQERKTAQRSQKSAEEKIYQTLELSSVELFRFEAKHPELVIALWYSQPDDSEPQTHAEMIKAHTLEQYICQHLNLFEMAFRLRRNNVVPPDVYASWVAWMYEVCALPVFAHIWTRDLRQHYITDFMRLMDEGVALAARDTAGDGFSEQAQLFYTAVAKAVGGDQACSEIMTWLQEAGSRAAILPIPGRSA